MPRNSDNYWGFLDSEEISRGKEYIEKGYVISDASSTDALERIRKAIVECARNQLGIPEVSTNEFLNSFHNYVPKHELNEIRLNLIKEINAKDWVRQEYWKIACPLLNTIVGNELAMQLRINLSIQLPNDDNSLLPVHADVWSGNSPFEVVVWLPLVDCYRTKSMFLLPPEKNQRLHQEFGKIFQKGSENLFRFIEKDVEWIEIPYGRVLIFNPNLPHGNRINVEPETRWSMNCRFKSVFSPYGGKKLGEFFEPITLRPASRIGLDYELPSTGK